MKVFSSNTALKNSSKCSFTSCKLRFFAGFFLVLKENPIHAKASKNQTC